MLLLPATMINKRYGQEHEEFHPCANILNPLTNWLQTLLVVYLVKLRLTSFNKPRRKLNNLEKRKWNFGLVKITLPKGQAVTNWLTAPFWASRKKRNIIHDITHLYFESCYLFSFLVVLGEELECGETSNSKPKTNKQTNNKTKFNSTSLDVQFLLTWLRIAIKTGKERRS